MTSSLGEDAELMTDGKSASAGLGGKGVSGLASISRRMASRSRNAMPQRHTRRPPSFGIKAPSLAPSVQ